MADEPRAIATSCPQCGQPSAWAVYTRGGVAALEVCGQPCACALTHDAWADLAEQAEAGPEGREA